MVNPSELIRFQRSWTALCWLFNPLSKRMHFNEKLLTVAKRIGNWLFSLFDIFHNSGSRFQNWFDHEWIDFGGFFCWNVPRFVVVISAWNKICKNCSIVFLIWRHEVFSMISLRGILVCSLNMPVFLQAWEMHCSFTSYVWASSILVFPQVMVDFWHGCITCEIENFYQWKDACNKAPHAV